MGVRLVQSLWTDAGIFRPRRHLFALHTLSLCMARQQHGEVHLVTDTRGAQIAERLGWEYASVSTALDDVDPALRDMWAVGKLHAILEQAGPFVHLDNDVLLFAPLPDRLLEANMFSERVDNPDHYVSDDIKLALSAVSLAPGLTAYNCGVMGGSNVYVWQRYARNGILLAHSMRHLHNGTACSMVFEQYWLGVFSRHWKIEVQTLLPTGPTEEEALAARYLHLAARIKHRPDVIEQVEVRLMRDFPSAYERFCSGWKRLDTPMRA